MEVLFLGTSGMHPTKERNLFSILVSHGSENILVDCGEGTQRQMRIAGFKSPKISKILITHLHGDHINGLPGLFQNLKANQYSRKLEIYGPKGLNDLMNSIFKIIGERLDIKITEIKNGVVFKEKDFYVEARELSHSVKVYGYSFIENDKRKINLDYLKKFKLSKHVLIGDLQNGKDIIYNEEKIKAKDATIIAKGKKLSIVVDTAYCNDCLKLAKDSDLLICESTFSDELKDKAKEYKHLTAVDAGTIAKKSKAKKLILTHISQRYNDSRILLKEAKKVFKESFIAEDFMKVRI